MPGDPETRLALRQANEARADFAAIEDHLDFIKDQLARLPTRKELWRVGMLGGAALTVSPPWLWPSSCADRLCDAGRSDRRGAGMSYALSTAQDA